MKRMMLLVTLVLPIAFGSMMPSAPFTSQIKASVALDWTDRLEALRPASPMAYFELAEEVADASAEPDQQELARRLFALAAVLDTSRLGASGCLAMADLETRAHVKRRLLAVASLLGAPKHRLSHTGAGQLEGFSRESAFHVAEAFSHYRRGFGSRALTSLKKPGAMELLESLDPLIRGGTQRFLEDCRLYNGQVRPSLSAANRARMLRLERALLSGKQRTWSGDLLLTDGSPLIEVDIRRLDEMLEVDVNRCLYRNGRWVVHPDDD